MTTRFVAAHEAYSRQWAVTDRNAEPGDWKAVVFRGNEAEANAVAAALHRANGLHLSVSAEAVANECNVTLGTLADADDSAEVYNLLLELIDATFGSSGEDPEHVARRIVTCLHLGRVCPRCDFVYLYNVPEACELCDERMVA